MVGAKRFPAEQNFTLTSTINNAKRSANINISMNDVNTDSNWDETTTISNKYKKIEAKDVLGKILSQGF